MTTPSTRHRRPLWPTLIAMVGAAGAITGIMLGVLGSSSDETARSMAKGVVIGAPIGLLIAVVAVLAQRRRYDRSTPMGRRASLFGDERSQRIATNAFAVTGLASWLLASAAAVAVAVGVEALAALAILIFALIATFVVAGLVLAART